MAKSKITKSMVMFICEKYDSETENYTFQDIAKMIEGEFNVSVTAQAVHQNYHKYKNDLSLNNSVVEKTKEKAVGAWHNRNQGDKPIRTISSVKKNLKDRNKGYDTSLEDDVDIDALFSAQNQTKK